MICLGMILLILVPVRLQVQQKIAAVTGNSLTAGVR